MEKKELTPMLNKMSEERIFTINKNNDDTFTIEEGCDEYFNTTLLPAELMQLAQELKMLLND